MPPFYVINKSGKPNVCRQYIKKRSAPTPGAATSSAQAAGLAIQLRRTYGGQFFCLIICAK